MKCRSLPTPDPADPDATAAHPAWVDYARRIAGSIGRRKGFANFIDDLESAALIGLVQAARSFRPDGGASFKNHAIRRISGAVLDELRAIRCNGFDGMGPSVRRGEFIPVGTLSDVEKSGDGTQTPIDIPSGELPVGWEVESEDEVRTRLAWFGRQGDLAADYFLRADRATLKRAAAAYGWCESRGSQIVMDVIERARGHHEERIAMNTNSTMNGTAKPDPGYGAWKDDEGEAEPGPKTEIVPEPSPPSAGPKNERLSRAMKEAWARRKANGETGPPKRAKPDLSGIDFTGHDPNPNRAHTITVAEPAKPEPQPATPPVTLHNAPDPLSALSAELDAARAILDALRTIPGDEGRKRVAGWVLGALNGIYPD